MTIQANPPPLQYSRFAEWFVVAILAIVLARVGYNLVDWATGDDSVENGNAGWVLWTSAVSIGTWTILWSLVRKRSRKIWMMAGAFSPLLGCLLFFPATPFALLAFLKLWYLFTFIGIGAGLVFHTVLSFLDWAQS